MGEYTSDFEYDSESDRKRRKRTDLTEKVPPAPQSSTSSSGTKKQKFVNPTNYSQALDTETRSIQRFHFLGLDAYSRHKALINEYLLITPGSTKILKRDTSRDQTDLDVIRQNHRFLWDEEDDKELTWEQRLAKKYYDKLFQEYCIADLRGYKQNKFGMRWRTEKEVVDGKGQFRCGSKHCEIKTGLKSWEVNFAYVENDVKKNALVKLRLCPECSTKLNFTKKHKDVSRNVILPNEHSANTEEAQKSDTKALSESELREQEKEIWEKPVLPHDDGSRSLEFDQYLTDMFL